MKKLTYSTLLKRIHSGRGRMDVDLIKTCVANGWISHFEAYELSFCLLEKLAPTLKTLAVDRLTGLATSSVFDVEIKNTIEDLRSDKKRDGEYLFVRLVALDMNGLKYFNDTYGHYAGDRALRLLTKIIRRSVRKGVDFVARWAGDEFWVIIRSTSLEGVEVAYTRLAAAVKTPQPLVLKKGGKRNTEYVSAGLGFVDVDRKKALTCSVESLKKEADLSLTANKAENRIERGARPTEVIASG